MPREQGLVDSLIQSVIHEDQEVMTEKFKDYDQNLSRSYRLSGQLLPPETPALQLNSSFHLPDLHEDSFKSQSHLLSSLINDEILEETKKKHENHRNIFQIKQYDCREELSSSHPSKELLKHKHSKAVHNNEAHLKFVQKKQTQDPKMKIKTQKTDYKYRWEEIEYTSLGSYLVQFKQAFK